MQTRSLLAVAPFMVFNIVEAHAFCMTPGGFDFRSEVISHFEYLACEIEEQNSQISNLEWELSESKRQIRYLEDVISNLESQIEDIEDDIRDIEYQID